MGIKRFYLVLIVFLTLFVSGCISPKSYVDPIHTDETYESLEKTKQPHKLKLVVQFQRSGKHYPKADGDVRGHVERVLRATGFCLPVNEDAEGVLTITINNTGDVAQAVAKGFGTGLTFGLVGSLVTDNYLMTASLTINGDLINSGSYYHAMHTTIGNKKGPENLEPMTPSAAFGKIVEQLVIKFVGDTQKKMTQTIGFRNG